MRNMKNMRNIFFDWNIAIDQPEVVFMKKKAIKLLKKSVGDAFWVFGDTYALKEQLEI